MQNERNHLVDALKGFGMILVVSGHSGTPFSKYYYTFHMGLFFFLSGYLMANTNRTDSFADYTRKKVKKLLFPYTCFFLISILFNELRLYKNTGHIFLLELGHFKAFFLGGGYLNDFTINFPLWFFQTIFIADLCMFFVLKLRDRTKGFFLIFLILITIPFQELLPERPIFHINVLPVALVYMLLGYGISKYLKRRIPLSYGCFSLAGIYQIDLAVLLLE